MCSEDSIWTNRRAQTHSSTNNNCYPRVGGKVWCWNIHHHSNKVQNTSAGKLMMTVFWNLERPLLVYFMPKAETVNNDTYCDLLQELKPKIRAKMYGKLSKSIILLEGDAQSHMVNQIRSLHSTSWFWTVGWHIISFWPESKCFSPFWLIERRAKWEFGLDKEVKKSAKLALHKVNSFFQKLQFEIFLRYRQSVHK